MLLGCVGAASAAELTLATAPPVVVRTEPVAGAAGVDPALAEIKVTFSKPMRDGSWSWSTWSKETFPEMAGEPRYLPDGRTCVLPVKLQPGRLYAVWLNSEKFKNFKDANNRPAVPYLLTFETAGGNAAVKAERRFVRLVVGKDTLRFQGSPIAPEELKAALEKVPDRAHTVLEIAATADAHSAKEFLDMQALAAQLAKELGFEYLSVVGVQALESKGGENQPSAAAPGQSPRPDDAWMKPLTDQQRQVLAWTDRQFRSFFDGRSFDGWSAAERADLEKQLVDTLKGPQSREYYQAINSLGALGGTNAVAALRPIAFDRRDKNNRDRWMAIRALGLMGDKESVPELIHLVYHGNVNTRWWAQISLVRLTGQNFGADWQAWGRWWNEQKGRPPFQPAIIKWWDGQAEPDKLAESLAENDRKFFASLQR